MEKLQLYFPVKPISYNQKFGENANGYYSAQGMKGHNGIDMMASHGQPVYASHDGLASFQIDNNGGHGVVLVTDKPYDYNGISSYFKTIYWHLCDGLKEPQFQSPIADKTGQTPIKRGDLIGYADNTGLTTGDHLHFGLKPVQQGEFWGTWFNLEPNNGYFGAIDPLPYLNGLFAHEGDTKFIFNNDMSYGQTSNDILELQKRLNIPLRTGYYGNVTKQAVFNFQLDNIPLSVWERYVEKGSHCGPKTRLALNK